WDRARCSWNRSASHNGGKKIAAACFRSPRLDVDFQLTLQELEAALLRRHHSAERRAGQGLTIGAVADRDRIRINLSFVTDVATMAPAVDLHRCVLPQLLTEPPSTTIDWPVTKSLSLDARNTRAPSRSSG